MAEVFFEGQSTESARALLAAAASLGLSPKVVRSTEDGFAVPQEVADALGPQEGVVVEPPHTAAEDKPKRTRKTPATAGND